MTARIIAIFVAPEHHAEQLAIDAVQLKAGKGIVGDRFYGLRKNQPGRNLTLIEVEVIASFNQAYQQAIPLRATRRNLVTQDIRLNDLVGKTFRVGEVLCHGVEFCEPCKVMARQMSCTVLSQSEIIQAFAYQGGIRAEVLSDGIIKMGDNIAITAPL
jgi:MOSC domain-containing protein YiiM